MFYLFQAAKNDSGDDSFLGVIEASTKEDAIVGAGKAYNAEYGLTGEDGVFVQLHAEHEDADVVTSVYDRLLKAITNSIEEKKEGAL